MKSIRNPSCVQVGYDLLLEIMNTYQIKSFIRGHQDGCHTQQGYTDCYDNILYTDGLLKGQINPNGENIGLVTSVKWDFDKDEPKFSCNKISNEKWCSLNLIFENIPTTVEQVKQQTITTSMTYKKGKMRTLAAPGAYIVIRGHIASHTIVPMYSTKTCKRTSYNAKLDPPTSKIKQPAGDTFAKYKRTTKSVTIGNLHRVVYRLNRKEFIKYKGSFISLKEARLLIKEKQKHKK